MRLAAKFALAVPLFLAATCLTLNAQEAPSPTGPPPKSKAPVEAEQPQDIQTLKIGTNLVNLYFSARDKSGYIPISRRKTASSLRIKSPRSSRTSPRKRTCR
jgi:hypothetical protein